MSRHMNKSTKHFNGTPPARARRAKVLLRLEKQLKEGTKPSVTEQIKGRNKVVKSELVPLTDDDVKRISKEIDIIKTRI